MPDNDGLYRRLSDVAKRAGCAGVLYHPVDLFGAWAQVLGELRKDPRIPFRRCEDLSFIPLEINERGQLVIMFSIPDDGDERDAIDAMDNILFSMAYGPTDHFMDFEKIVWYLVPKSSLKIFFVRLATVEHCT